MKSNTKKQRQDLEEAKKLRSVETRRYTYNQYVYDPTERYAKWDRFVILKMMIYYHNFIMTRRDKNSIKRALLNDHDHLENKNINNKMPNFLMRWREKCFLEMKTKYYVDLFKASIFECYLIITPDIEKTSEVIEQLNNLTEVRELSLTDKKLYAKIVYYDEEDHRNFIVRKISEIDGIKKVSILDAIKIVTSKPFSFPIMS